MLDNAIYYIIVVAAHTPEGSRASFKSYWETLGVNFQILLDKNGYNGCATLSVMLQKERPFTGYRTQQNPT